MKYRNVSSVRSPSDKVDVSMGTFVLSAACLIKTYCPTDAESLFACVAGGVIRLNEVNPIYVSNSLINSIFEPTLVNFVSSAFILFCVAVISLSMRFMSVLEGLHLIMSSSFSLCCARIV